LRVPEELKDPASMVRRRKQEQKPKRIGNSIKNSANQYKVKHRAKSCRNRLLDEGNEIAVIKQNDRESQSSSAGK